jgi:hypothetical protein
MAQRLKANVGNAALITWFMKRDVLFVKIVDHPNVVDGMNFVGLNGR